MFISSRHSLPDLLSFLTSPLFNLISILPLNPRTEGDGWICIGTSQKEVKLSLKGNSPLFSLSPSSFHFLSILLLICFLYLLRLSLSLSLSGHETLSLWDFLFKKEIHQTVSALSSLCFVLFILFIHPQSFSTDDYEHFLFFFLHPFFIYKVRTRGFISDTFPHSLS